MQKQTAPNADRHNPNPAYLKGLIEDSGLSVAEVARRIGLSRRLLHQYTAPRAAASAREAPYAVQFALECLALRG